MAAVGLVDVSDVARTATAAGVVEPVPTVGVLPSVGTHLFIVRESTSKAFESSPAGKPCLLDQVRAAVRTRHYSLRTEKAYIGWIRRYVVFHGKRHPSEMGEAEIARFLTHLAVRGKVSASTQNQALSALLFLYREVLRKELPWVDGIVRAKCSIP